jgi:hypothetical protein
MLAAAVRARQSRTLVLATSIPLCVAMLVGPGVISRAGWLDIMGGELAGDDSSCLLSVLSAVGLLLPVAGELALRRTWHAVVCRWKRNFH